MLEWFRRRSLIARDEFVPVAEPAKHRQRAMSGQYLPLYTYLERRFAGTVVLTVAQIEDILGFALPAGARLDLQWWAAPSQDTVSPHHQDAWLLAGRTATPNLSARTIAFDRPA